MEFLQGFQYFWIDDCDNFWNQFLTVLGFLHICLQPYFTHIINSSLTKNPKVLNQYEVILRMCLLGGALLFVRLIIAEYGLFSTGIDYNIVSDFSDYTGNATERAALPGYHRTKEWLRGEKICTFSGKFHLAWSVPMSEPTYWVPSAAIHSFLMFGPFFVIKKNMVIQGVFLWLAGPFAASYITSNLMEQASIWCFFSILQIGIMLFLIREQLLIHWGKKSDSNEKLSIHTTHKKSSTNGVKKNGVKKNGVKSNGKVKKQ
jgi:hypothetical protein